MAVAAKSLSQQEESHCLGRSYQMNRQFLLLTVELVAVMGTAVPRGTYLPATPPCSA